MLAVRNPMASTKRRRWPSIFIVALTLVVACQSSGPTASPSAPATQWQQVLAGIGPNGEVDAATALSAFSVAVGPLPGVNLPTGAPPTSAEIIDGAAPVRWLLRVWDQLTLEQQQAATAALDALGTPDFTPLTREPTARAEPRIALAGALPGSSMVDTECGIWQYSVTEPPIALPAAVQPYAEDLQRAAVAFAGHLRRDPVLKWGACLIPSNGAVAATVTRVFDASGGDKGEADHCVIQLNSGYFQGLKESDPGRYGYAISVAAFRCFLATAAYYGPAVRAPYVEEGITAWAAGTVSNELFDGPAGALDNVWPGYLLVPGESLFTRSWDAVGFYSQLGEIEVVWDFIDPMLRAADGESAFYLSGARAVAFRALWAAGYFRDPGRGAEWDIVGPGVTGDVSLPSPLAVANGTSKTVPAGPVSVAIAEVTATADVTYVGGTDIRFSDGAIDQQMHNNSFAYCTKDGGKGDCTCPPDSLRGQAGLPPPPPLASPFHFGVTGTLDGGNGTLQGWSLDDFCVKQATPKPRPTQRPSAKPKGAANPCAKGCAGSVGDPHLETIDLGEYDFQAAGEYELLRSPDGSVEIQARQAAYPDVADASINTGLAWRVNGHRITMYPEEGGFVVRLDGTDVDPFAGTIDLGEGAALTLLDLGVEVVFSDGTITTAFFHGNGFADALDIKIAPSDSLRVQGVGLLGPIAAGSELPAMPDGSVLPISTDRSTRYDQRYHQLGPAWHVTDQTSLFDYGPGETTATFDQPGFPSPDVAFDVAELQARDGLQAFQDAADQCAGVQADQEEYLHCIFDVMATKDPAYAEFYKLVLEFLANGPTALEQTGPAVTPGPQATPTSTLPGGFFEIVDAAIVNGASVDADGTVFVSVTNADQTYALVALDPASGEVRRSTTMSGGGRVLLLDGSVWAAQSDPTGFGQCSVLRLDPTTLEESATIPVVCDIFGVSVVAVQNGLWWLDRSTSDIDGKRALLRHVDPATNQVDRSVELPFANGYLSSSATTAFFGDSGEGWYRLLPGATAFEAMPAVDTPFYPSGEGVWVGDALAGTAAFFTAGQSPDKVLPVEGPLTAADESSVYTTKSGNEQELWRYPRDGSGPSMVAASTTLQTDRGDQPLYYSDLFIGEHQVATIWTVYGLTPGGTATVIAQVAPLP